MIRNLFLFSGLDFDVLDKKYGITASRTSESYRDGEAVSYSAKGIGIVKSGRLKITSAASPFSAVIRYLQQGDVFGAASLFKSEDSEISQITSEGEAEAVYLPSDTVYTLCTEEPAAAMNYIMFLSNRVAFLNTRLMVFTQGKAEAKIAAYLLSFADGGENIQIPVSYSRLSGMLGIGRASLYRVFDRLEDAGIIKRAGNNVTLLQPERLRMILNQM